MRYNITMTTTLTFLLALNLSLLIVVVVFLVKIRRYSAEIDSGHTIDHGEVIIKIQELADNYAQKHEDLMREIIEYKKAVADGTVWENDDEMYEAAEKAVREMGKASTSFLQRKLGIGYSRAASLIDRLEENEVIGPANGATSREVLEEDVVH